MEIDVFLLSHKGEVSIKPLPSENREPHGRRGSNGVRVRKDGAH